MKEKMFEDSLELNPFKRGIVPETSSAAVSA